MRVSEKTIRRLLCRGELKGIRVGAQWRFPIENLTELLPSGVSASPGEDAAAAPPRTAAIRDLIEVGGIHYRIAGDTPRKVLREIVNATSCVPPAARPGLFKAIWERESLCSTGIGNRIAVPHPKVPMPTPYTGIPSCVGLFFLEHPVDFGSVDKEKVSVLFLLLLKAPQEHLQALSRLIRLLREDSLLNLLHEVPLRAAIHAELVRLEGVLFPEGP
ncbi:MAG: PTS sugar transporter subunit IIA [Deltaproteobacteria bacterium]|nr:PTS sugar transporter subunit IIA [Deltaproteobacteria bacterium]